MPTEPARILADTGPLVAVLNAADEHHAWAREVFGRLPPPVFTCESVLSEAQFLLHGRGGDPLTVLDWVQRGVINLAFDAEDEIERLLALQKSYRALPMDFADATLVALAEQQDITEIFTLDRRGFETYRVNGRKSLVIYP